ncbi:MAG: hypothetical protein LC792_15180 [Actinobacteria bacterium]|nr:hypothetical protein [Actinomycetota bacterium]
MTMTNENAAPARRAKQGRSRRPGVGPVAERLDALSEAAREDPARAREEAWQWIRALGAKRDAKTLEALFEMGTPPAGLNGPADGMLVTTLVNPLVDAQVHLLTRLWMPWKGKVFDARAKTGVNRIAPNAELPFRLLWPLYKLRDRQGEKAAFEFVSGREPGKIEPRVPVLKIDYQPVGSNPQFLVRQIRDELVELIDDVYLGRILFRLPAGRFANIGYFALRQPAAG